MSVEIKVRYGESIDVVLSKLRRGCLNANISATLKEHQYYIKPSLIRHAEKQEVRRKKKFQKKRTALVDKYGIESIPRRKKGGNFS